jgi:uroporphyrinogen-III decarboxylase
MALKKGLEMLNNYIKVIDKYQDLRSVREHKAKMFLDGTRPYMIFQTPAGVGCGSIRTSRESFKNNMECIEKSLNVPSDHLPVMEPWFGTGVYANMYGCPYVWRDDESPAVHYKYHSIDEIKNIPQPRWEDGEIARLVIATIDYFKSQTGDALPIVWTDTQSASDTATLVLDACEVMMGSLIEPDAIMRFMNDINDLIIKFSLVQAERIGDALIMPGHIMLSNAGLSGMSISDDNLAVASPDVNAKFNLPLNEKIGQAMGGVAIHSCGRWQHTMGMVKELVPSCVAIDCALDKTCDPGPNDAEAVRDAFAGSGIHVHVRLTGETKEMCETVKRLLHPDLKLIIHPGYIDAPAAERNYYELESILSNFYQ